MAKGIMVIDGQRVPFDGERNVLAVIRKAGIDIPTFCYYSDLSVHGACRMCIVEDVKTGKIDASCSMEPRDGMEIRTNTARLLRHRRMILELLLAAHDCSCTTCAKSGNCRLQELAQRFGVRHIRFPNNKPRYEKDYTSYAVFRDPNKCILCGDCVRVCEELQGQGILNFAFRGSELQVMPAFDKKLGETKCVGCGQCAAVCTTGAITVNDQIGTAWAAIHDPKKRVVVQIAPAVRVAVGEAFGIPAGVNVIDKMTTALKLMGVDEVYDTNFGADMTTILEAEEFLQRLKNGGPFPMFTSCCPAWVRYLEFNDPKYLKHISTCKSPMEMFAAVIRDKYAEKDAADGRTTYNIAIMPCTAKKMEAARPEFVHNGRPDVDLVLTTRELVDMMRETGVQLDELVEQSLRSAAIWDEVKDRLRKSAFGLSGGQQQRLCIARALAVKPEVLLMDEPTSALDPISTLKIEDLATELKKDYTIVMVTHNMQQATRISDKTAFFLLGEVVEFGVTDQIFSMPKDKRTEDYITGRFG